MLSPQNSEPLRDGEFIDDGSPETGDLEGPAEVVHAD
jgi:hypothetical protein